LAIILTFDLPGTILWSGEQTARFMCGEKHRVQNRSFDRGTALGLSSIQTTKASR